MVAAAAAAVVVVAVVVVAVVVVAAAAAAAAAVGFIVCYCVSSFGFIGFTAMSLKCVPHHRAMLCTCTVAFPYNYRSGEKCINTVCAKWIWVMSFLYRFEWNIHLIYAVHAASLHEAWNALLQLLCLTLS